MGKNSPHKLSPFERAFLNEYQSNGYNNQTQAYLAIRPHVTATTAATEASKLLRSPYIQAELDKRIDKGSVLSLASKDKILEEMHEVREKALKKNKLQTCLNASVEKAKLSGLYQQDDTGVQGYKTLIQALTINVNPVKGPETIDITENKDE